MSLRFLNGHWVGTFRDECWNTSYHFIWPTTGRTLTGAMVARYVKRTFGVPWPIDDDFSGLCETFPAFGTQLIVLRTTSGSAEFFDTLAHECFHAAHNTLDASAVKLTMETKEAFAYLTGSLVGRALLLIGKSRKRRIKS